MTGAILPWMLAAVGLCMMAAAFVLLRLIEADNHRRLRLEAMQRSAGLEVMAEAPGQAGSPGVRLVAALGHVLSRSGLLPASTLAELSQTLAACGFRQSNALSLFIGGKLLLFLLLPLLCYLPLQQIHVKPAMRPLLLGGAAVTGLLAPDTLLRRMRRAHLDGVARGLPDALDMLVICTEAGLGLEHGIDRVATEIAPAHPAVALELQITATEMRILSDRRLALTNMGTRTGLVVMQRLGGTLIQTLQYGTPLSQALRTLAAEMRYEMQVRFEAQAARLPVLLTLPMIVFILPCIFIVVGGPAALTVQRNLIHHPK